MTIRRRLAIISFTILAFPFLLMIVGYLLVVAPLKHGEIIDFDFMPPSVYSAALDYLGNESEPDDLEESGVIGIMLGEKGFIYLHPSLTREIKENDDLTFNTFITRGNIWPFDKTIGISRFSYHGENGTVFFQLSQKHPSKWMKNNSVAFAFFLLLTLIVLPSVLSYILLMGLRKDLSHLVDGAAKISDDTLDFKLTIPKDKAIKPVFTAFEDMRSRLAENKLARKRFLTSISHDLKTPLTSIKGYLEVLQDGMEENSQEREKYYKILRDKSELLEQRIQELIDFARMEEVDWKHHFEKINAKEFFDESMDVFLDEAKSRGRKLLYTNTLTKGVGINGDRNMLFRVFENLFENSFRYTGKNDKIECIIEPAANSNLKITIRDNGPGIKPKDRKLIFEPFYRGENSRNSYGVGLGLSTVKTIIEAHFGSITLEETGETCFTIVLKCE